MSIDRESNSIIIPEAYIIDELNEKTYEIREEIGYAHPPYDGLDIEYDPKPVEQSCVIIIDL